VNCLGCQYIESEPLTLDGKTLCARCPSVQARILQSMDLFGRRAMLVRIDEQHGPEYRLAVEAELTEMWKAKSG